MARFEIHSTHVAVMPEIEHEIERLVGHAQTHVPLLESVVVTVTGPVIHHERGPFEVHVTLGAPKATVTVSRTRDAYLRTAIQEAFAAAESRLQSRMERRRTLTRNAAARAREKRRGTPWEWGLGR